MTKFKWKKLGIIFEPKQRHPWMQSHAQVPYSVEFDDFLRVYFSTREVSDENLNFRSYSGYVDLDKSDITKILAVSDRPILSLGALGEFDEFGTMAGSVLRVGQEYLLYYCGWQRSISVPYNWAIGLAKSADGATFKKIAKGPLFSGSLQEPYLQACPIVYRFADEDWHMFYLSGVRWIEDGKGKKESQYLIMHAKSKNGIDWIRNGTPVVPTLLEDECQTSSSILIRNGKYHMFFSYRAGTDFRTNPSRSYRIGYATSKDLESWERDDSLAGISVGAHGWDSLMIAYPHICEVKGKIYMFYCGNEFGKSGFGCAVLEE